MSVSQYPIDFEAVEKGQVFLPERLVEILGKKIGTKEYTFAVIGLSAMIQERTGYTTKITEQGLRVLTDSEATDRNHDMFHRHQRGMSRRYALMANVDTEQLSGEQAQRHDRRLVAQSRTLQAIKWAARGRALPEDDTKKIAEGK